MAKKRFITASSPDAGEVAAKVSLSSSAGSLSISLRRSPDPPAAAPLRRFEDFPFLPRSRQPTKFYLGSRQRPWGTWVAEIIDQETHTCRWLGSFHMAELRPWSTTAGRSATTARRLGSISPSAHVWSTSFRRSQGW